ncbi:hypothetical protein DFP74_1292 [Nocardiopsis sp. Huas11]|uniref:hypothetical protein n=1 Tax=Nocardiopsis sp. Huas11 TaxID=2183912 RepID=UPI000F2839A8|nr:hypothetical protein [Nocardiopsis sp. Huas11]RKS05687.1 hypothetical protein DFP74_1292 [Nocardiopsis sp. Huas11]
MLSIDQQLREMLTTPGVRSVSLVDWRQGATVSLAGAEDRPAEAVAIVRAIGANAPFEAEAVEDVVVTDAEHHLLIAVLKGSDLCVQVRMERDGGHLGFALRRLRGLAGSARLPPPRRDPGRRDPGRPPRRERGRPAPRAASTVDRAVLERVLTGLRSLSVDRPWKGSVIA